MFSYMRLARPTNLPVIEAVSVTALVSLSKYCYVDADYYHNCYFYSHFNCRRRPCALQALFYTIFLRGAAAATFRLEKKATSAGRQASVSVRSKRVVGYHWMSYQQRKRKGKSNNNRHRNGAPNRSTLARRGRARPNGSAQRSTTLRRYQNEMGTDNQLTSRPLNRSI